MNRCLTACLLTLLVFFSSGCTATQDSSAQTEVSVENTTVTAAATEAPEVVLTEPTEEEYLFFTVSDITFSLTGESEDIYLGNIPREKVIWSSSDESVVTFSEGILTATGVGSASVFAEYGTEVVEITVTCLAQTQEDLDALGDEILRTPKRFPYHVEDWPEDFYNDAAFVGDSITYTLWHTAGKPQNELGKSLFLVRGGTSINGFVLNYKNITYQGKEMHLDDAIAASGMKKAFFMLGQNDLGYMSIEDTMANWTKLLDRILEKSPEVEIYLQSLVPEWNENHLGAEKNEKIDQYNEALKIYCEENGYYFVDIAPYIEDHTNKMATIYSMDYGIHINYDGTAVWMDALKAYATLHELRGA